LSSLEKDCLIDSNVFV